MDVSLSKDAKKLLKLLYQYYRDRLDGGEEKSDAKCTGSAHSIQAILTPEKTVDWVEEACGELEQRGFLAVLYADNTVFESALENKAIIYMENIRADRIKCAIEILSKLKFW